MPATQGITVRQTIETQQDRTNTNAMTSLGIPFANYGPGKNVHFRCHFLVQSQGAGGFRFRLNGANSPMMAFRCLYDIDTGFVAMANVLSTVSAQAFTGGGSTIVLWTFEGSCRFGAAANTLDLAFGQNIPDPLPSSVMIGSYMEITVL